MPFKINIIETGSSDCPAFLKDRVSNDLFPNMKIGCIFECGSEGPDVQVCRHLVHRLDPAIEFISSTLDAKRNLVENCGALAKVLLDECEKVIIVWDLYPAWRERGIRH